LSINNTAKVREKNLTMAYWGII